MVCETWDSYSVLWRALAVSVLTVWTLDRTLWNQSTSVWAEAVSRLSHMVSKPFCSSCRKNARHSIETNVQGWIGQSCSFC